MVFIPTKIHCYNNSYISFATFLIALRKIKFSRSISYFRRSHIIIIEALEITTYLLNTEWPNACCLNYQATHHDSGREISSL